MRITLLATCLLVVFAACKNSKPKEEQVQTPTQVDSTEKFDAFFAKFKTDSSFQVSRIKFPVKVYRYKYELGDAVPQGADDEELIVVDTLLLANYTFMTFEDRLGQETDNYKIETEVHTNEAAVSFVGVDNGINTSMVFEKINGQWFLTKIEDESA